MKLWKNLAFVSSILLASASAISCNNNADMAHVYDYSAIADELQGTSDLYDILGATVLERGVNFAVFAKNATRVELLIFDPKNPDTDYPLTRIPMSKNSKSGIWTVYVEGIGVGTHYGYIAFGPNWPYNPDFKPGTTIGFITDCDEQGNRYNPNKLLMDPYARRIHRDFDWMAGGNPASGTARDVSDWKSSPKSVVIRSEYVWSDNEANWRDPKKKGKSGFKGGHSESDLIFYEVQPMGFTKKAFTFTIGSGRSKKTIEVKNPGTYRGIGEMAPYLKDLGITALELLPPMEKPDDGGYWGYNTIQFFAPEQRFATEIDQKKTNGVHDEFKEMVDKLHQAGIEVILDIVFNHTGEGGFWQSKVAADHDYAGNYGAQDLFNDKTAVTLFSFRGLDNKSYYHLVQDNRGKSNQYFLDETGVGNQPRANVLPFRRFIVDNLRFWVEEMHVDGFRFDLASILGVLDEQISQYGDSHNFDNAYWAEHVGETVLQDIIDDEMMAMYKTRFIAEPWSLSQYVNGLFPKSKDFDKNGQAWFEWNGRYRDLLRPFINDDGTGLSASANLAPYFNSQINFGNVLTGSSSMFGDDGRKPYHSVNIVTVHDGFTLFDLETYNQKRNGCSLLNPTCCSDPYNSFCKTDSGDSNNHSRDWCGGNKDTQGTCNDPNAEAYKRQVIRTFFAMMMISHGSPLILGGDEFMRSQFGNNDAYSDGANNEWNWFRWGDWLTDENRVRMHDFVRDMIALRKEFKEYLSPSDYNSPLRWRGVNTNYDPDWGGKAIAQQYGDSLYILINMTGSDVEFTLPGGVWYVRADTQVYFEKTDGKNAWSEGERPVVDNKYGTSARSVVILSK